MPAIPRTCDTSLTCEWRSAYPGRHASSIWRSLLHRMVSKCSTSYSLLREWAPCSASLARLTESVYRHLPHARLEGVHAHRSRHDRNLADTCSVAWPPAPLPWSPAASALLPW